MQGENEREYVYVLDLSKMYTSECIGSVAAQPTNQQLAMEDLRKIYKNKRKICAVEERQLEGREAKLVWLVKKEKEYII